MMPDLIKSTLFVLAIGAVVVAAVSCEYSVWSECREKNSWMYCVRTLSK